MTRFATPTRSPFAALFDRLATSNQQQEVDDIVDQARALAGRADQAGLTYLEEADRAEADGAEDFAAFLRDADARWYELDN
jgi:hypothetical protein